jgi:hypothetical protein
MLFNRKPKPVRAKFVFQWPERQKTRQRQVFVDSRRQLTKFVE